MNGGELPLPCPDHAGRFQLGLRPEHILLQDGSPWRGQVVVVEPTGADTYVVIDTVAGRVTVRTSPQLSVKPGERVGLQVQGEHASWFDATSGARIGA
jgi:multiple sugar transport system ATP-binding protein